MKVIKFGPKKAKDPATSAFAKLLLVDPNCSTHLATDENRDALVRVINSGSKEAKFYAVRVICILALSGDDQHSRFGTVEVRNALVMVMKSEYQNLKINAALLIAYFAQLHPYHKLFLSVIEDPECGFSFIQTLITNGKEELLLKLLIKYINIYNEQKIIDVFHSLILNTKTHEMRLHYLNQFKNFLTTQIIGAESYGEKKQDTETSGKINKIHSLIDQLIRQYEIFQIAKQPKNDELENRAMEIIQDTNSNISEWPITLIEEIVDDTFQNNHMEIFKALSTQYNMFLKIGFLYCLQKFGTNRNLYKEIFINLLNHFTDFDIHEIIFNLTNPPVKLSLIGMCITLREDHSLFFLKMLTKHRIINHKRSSVLYQEENEEIKGTPLQQSIAFQKNEVLDMILENRTSDIRNKTRSKKDEIISELQSEIYNSPRIYTETDPITQLDHLRTLDEIVERLNKLTEAPLESKSESTNQMQRSATVVLEKLSSEIDSFNVSIEQDIETNNDNLNKLKEKSEIALRNIRLVESNLASQDHLTSENNIIKTAQEKVQIAEKVLLEIKNSKNKIQKTIKKIKSWLDKLKRIKKDMEGTCASIKINISENWEFINRHDLIEYFINQIESKKKVVLRISNETKKYEIALSKSLDRIREIASAHRTQGESKTTHDNQEILSEETTTQPNHKKHTRVNESIKSLMQCYRLILKTYHELAIESNVRYFTSGTSIKEKIKKLNSIKIALFFNKNVMHLVDQFTKLCEEEQHIDMELKASFSIFRSYVYSKSNFETNVKKETTQNTIINNVNSEIAKFNGAINCLNCNE